MPSAIDKADALNLLAPTGSTMQKKASNGVPVVAGQTALDAAENAVKSHCKTSSHYDCQFYQSLTRCQQLCPLYWRRLEGCWHCIRLSIIIIMRNIILVIFPHDLTPEAKQILDLIAKAHFNIRENASWCYSMNYAGGVIKEK